MDSIWKSGTFQERRFYCRAVLLGSQQDRLIKFYYYLCSLLHCLIKV